MKRTRGRHPWLLTFAHSWSLIGVISLVIVSNALAFTPRPVQGRLLLQLRDGVEVQPFDARSAPAARKTGQLSLDALSARFGVTNFDAQFAAARAQGNKTRPMHDMSRFFILQFPETIDLETVRAAYALDPSVAVAEFDWLEPLYIDPNDGVSQWHLESSQGHDAHLPGGWNHSQGSTSVLLGIADSGVDWAHPDLSANVWVNPGEVPNDFQDNDLNGFVDDVRGWDFVGALQNAWPGEDAIQADNDPADFNGHGTHVAGIAAASTNNGIGVAGVAWGCKILALRIGGSINDAGAEQGVVLMSAAAQALDYARIRGAAGFNCSWGSSNVSSLRTAVDNAVSAGMVIVVAAGNDNATTPSYLSSRGDCFDVAATTNTDQRASFSNYGAWVDICAPGEAIYSTYFFHGSGSPHGYTSLQGTSMAAPIVTGLVGLVKSAFPGYTGAQIKIVIRNGCDNIDAITGMPGAMGSGRVNALRTFQDYHLAVPNEYATFEKALAASGPGDTLSLQGGVVFNNRMYLWRSDRYVLGGWNASFTSRDPVNNPTVVHVPGGGPALEFVAGINQTLVVDGFSFTGGVARDLSTPITGLYGGGVLCISASPLLRNCRFVSNTAGDAFTAGGGGGGFFANSSSQLVNCTFSSNQAQLGVGLYAYNSNLVITGGTISGNTAYDGSATTTGAGVRVSGGTLNLDGTTIENNTGADEGGGVYVDGATLTGHAVALRGNSALSTGGNLRLAAGAAASLTACEVRTGGAPFGAGIAAASGTSMTLRATILANNVAPFIGGGIYAQGANAILTNVTWNANRGTAGGGDAIYAGACPVAWTIRNSLVSNHSTATNTAFFFQGAAPALDWNMFWNNAGGNIAGGSLGVNDVVQDPRYVDAGTSNNEVIEATRHVDSTGDVALGVHSPAIDSGDPSGSLNDPDGSRNDRGAYGGPGSMSRAPAVPAGLSLHRLANPPRNILTWSANPAPDVQYVAVYRGASSNFVPSAANYIGQSPVAVLSYTDQAGGPNDWYRLAAVDVTGAASGYGPAVKSGPTDAPPTMPERFALHPNAPNPFNPTTLLRFDLPEPAQVRLTVFDPAGRLVRVLATGAWPAGRHTVRWDGRDSAGRDQSSGVYVARLDGSREHATRKMILVR